MNENDSSVVERTALPVALPEEVLDHVLFSADGKWIACFIDGTRREMTPLERHLWTKLNPLQAPTPDEHEIARMEGEGGIPS